MGLLNMDKNKTQLDPQVVTLAKALRSVESGGNFSARGGSGEYGAYQYTKPTWQATAQKYLGDANADIRDPKNQNKATYLKLKEWKDKGYNVGQIASMWNAGEGRPNAYKENFRGVNKYGVAYDTPAYAKKVASTYQKMKQSMPAVKTVPGSEVVNAEVVTEAQVKKPTFGGRIARDILKTPARILENVKAIPKVIGGQSYDEATKGSESKYFGETITPIGTKGNFGQKVKDSVGAGLELASYLPAGAGVKSVGNVAKQTIKGQLAKGGGRELLKKGAKLYAEGAGATALYEGGKKMQGEEGRGNFVKNVALGGATGLGVGAVGAVVGKTARQARKLVAGTKLSPSIPQDIKEEAVEELSGAWNGLTDEYKNLRDFSNRQKAKGKNSRDISKILTDEVLVPEVKDGVLDTRGIIETASDRITDYADKSRKILANFDDKKTTLETLKKEIESVVKDSPDINASGNLKKALKDIDNKIEGFREAYGDTLTPTNMHDIRIRMNEITKAFNTDMFEQDTANAIGDAVRSLLDSTVDDDIYRRTNKQIGDLMVAKQYLKKADGRKIGGGKMSQMMARLTGATIGSQGNVPIISPVLGAMGGDKAQKVLRQWSFASPNTRRILRKVLKNSDLDDEIAQKTAQGAKDRVSRETVQLLPARTSQNNVKMESGKTIALPAKTQTSAEIRERANKAIKKPQSSRPDQLMLPAPSEKTKVIPGKTIGLPRRTQSTIDDAERSNIAFSKVSKGDEIQLDGKEYSVKQKTSVGAILMDQDGNRKFVPLKEFKNITDVTDQNIRGEAEAQVMTELDLSEAGKRIIRDYNDITIVPSTFPKWIPEELRSKELFNRMTKKIQENKVQKLGSREKKLYTIILDKIRDRFEDIKKARSAEDLIENLGPEQAFAFAPFLIGGSKIIEENDDYKVSKKGVFGNRTVFERKKGGDKVLTAPKIREPKEPLGYTPRPETDLPVKISKDDIRNIEKQFSLDPGILSAIMMLESSMGTNTAKADKGEFKWLTGLTEIAIKDIKRKVNVGDPRDILKATAEFIALLKKRYPKKTFPEIYTEKYWTQYKDEEQKKKKEDQVEQLLSFYK